MYLDDFSRVRVGVMLNNEIDQKHTCKAYQISVDGDSRFTIPISVYPHGLHASLGIDLKAELDTAMNATTIQMIERSSQ